MHKGDVDAVDTKPLETIFDRSPNTGCRIVEDHIVGRRRKREVLFVLRSFRSLKQFAHLRRKNVFAPLLVMKEVAVAALSQTQSVPRGHVVVSDASGPCCFDRGVGVLVGDNLEFVAKRNTPHAEFEGWFVMPYAITARSLRRASRNSCHVCR